MAVKVIFRCVDQTFYFVRNGEVEMTLQRREMKLSLEMEKYPVKRNQAV